MSAPTLDLVATKAGHEPRTIAIEVLTDEEVSVLVPDRGVVVAPVLDEVPEADRDAVRRTAYRGLLARGIVEAPDPEAVAAAAAAPPGPSGDVALDLRVRNDVLSALTLRSAATAVVAVGRTTAEAQDFWYAHLVEEVVLVEQVGTDGLHRFSLGHARDLPDLLRAVAVHPDARDGAGEEVELAVAPDSEAPAELVERLGRAYLRADVLVVRREAGAPVEAPELTGVFTGPEGSWSVVSRPGSQRAWARPETAAGVVRRVEGLAAQARAAVTATAGGQP
ncbi:hypothetical protein [Nocardioides litoris]|uniref:hypothetical protein n=1 Tax=Nocardioides litoris TaxID=1926648 RepID=UPI001122CD1A|nr:hypothetical protein [Nocardioides litoris]